MSRPTTRRTVGSTLLLLIALAVIILPAPVHAIQDSTVGKTSENLQFGYPGGSDSFYLNGLYWLWYVNVTGVCQGNLGSDCLGYSTSPDGTTWTKGAGIGTGFVANDSLSQPLGDFAAATNGQYVCFAYTSYRPAITYGAVNVNCAPAATANACCSFSGITVVQHSDGSHFYYGISIAFSTDGTLWLSYADCTSNCIKHTATTVATQLADYNIQLSSATIFNGFNSEISGTLRQIMLPETVGKMMLLNFGSTSGIIAYEYNPNTGLWNGGQSISSSSFCSGFDLAVQAIRTAGDNIWVVWQAFQTTNMCFNYHNGGLWGAAVPIPGLAFYPCTPLNFYSCFSLSFEPNTGTYHIFTYYATSSNITDYQGTDPTALKKTALLSTGPGLNATNFIRSMPTSVSINSTWRIPLWWTEQVSSLFTMNYAVDTGPIPPPTSGGTPPTTSSPVIPGCLTALDLPCIAYTKSTTKAQLLPPINWTAVNPIPFVIIDVGAIFLGLIYYMARTPSTGFMLLDEHHRSRRKVHR